MFAWLMRGGAKGFSLAYRDRGGSGALTRREVKV
jgi:hypothetical protein